MLSHDVCNPESVAMRFLKKLGLRRLRWSMRRLHCPVSKDALVLEVGAGGNPYPRANVLLDAMESTIERSEKNLVRDRPLVLGICEELPFRDKSFDFIIASHVLEHSEDPEKFLTELCRVGKAGYIETPDGWFEKMCAFRYHRLEVSKIDGKLIIKKKKSWKPDEISYHWDVKLSNSKELAEFLRVNPDLNTMRFYWSDTIYWEVVNPETDAGWPYPADLSVRYSNEERTFLHVVRFAYLNFRRWMFSRNNRNRSIDILNLIRCPDCHSSDIKLKGGFLSCSNCSRSYEIKDGVPYLFPSELTGFNLERCMSINSERLDSERG